MIQRILVIAIAICSTISCSHQKSKKDISDNNLNQTVKYAKGFTLTSIEGAKLLTVLNPWQSSHDVDYKYLFIDSTQSRNDYSSLNAEVFIAPLKRVVCFSSTHIAYIDLLENTSTIVGVSGSGFVHSNNLRKRIDKDLVKDVGYDQNLNYELIVSLKPDAVLCYGVGAESVGYLLKLKELDVKIIFIGDYLEENPLGKAEWIKAFGTFFNLNDKADSLFKGIDDEYNRAVKVAEGIKDKPRVFLNLPWKDSWFFPGKSNYFIKLIEDAGGDYVFNNLTGSKSYPLSFEKAIEAGYGSDFWLNPGSAISMNDIERTDERLLKVPPCINNKVYNNNLRSTLGGGNDFWESGAVHPDLILKDLIFIFHPELLPNHQFYYYRKIE